MRFKPCKCVFAQGMARVGLRKIMVGFVRLNFMIRDIIAVFAVAFKVKIR